VRKEAFTALLCVAFFGGPNACDTGGFPAFLEPLDPLDPVEGAAKSWLLSSDKDTEILVLSESGDFLRSWVRRDTSVVLEIGTFEISGIQMQLRSKYRYEFPIETGPVNSRQGAQMEEVSTFRNHRVELVDGHLELEGVGSYLATTDFLGALDLSQESDRGCLLRFVQMSIRTVQARIRNFGGSGTAIYHRNQVEYAGFLEGELSIVLEGSLLSPDTRIRYASFRDFPELRLEGTFITHVHNTSGDATMDEAIDFQVIRPSSEEETEMDSSGLGGGGGAFAEEILVEGSLDYGSSPPIEIEGGDVVGGSYTFSLLDPEEEVDERAWTFLSDLDFRHCLEHPNSESL
jgi:hypothetical protein